MCSLLKLMEKMFQISLIIVIISFNLIKSEETNSEFPCIPLYKYIQPCCCFGWENGTISYFGIKCVSNALNSTVDYQVDKIFLEASKQDHLVKNFEKLTLWPLRGSVISKSFLGDFKFRIIEIAESNLSSIDLNGFGSNYEFTEEIRLVNITFSEELRNGRILFEVLKRFKKLKHLYIQNTNLKAVPRYAFQSDTPQKYLESIVIMSNDVDEIGDYAFYDLPNLKVLELQCNKLRRISGNSFSFASKTIVPIRIYLNFNPISTRLIEMGSFTRLNRPTKLYLVSGNLTSLAKSIFYPPFKYNDKFQVYVPGNPFVCGCDALWLLENKRRYKEKVKLMHCEDGVNIWEKSREDFKFCYPPAQNTSRLDEYRISVVTSISRVSNPPPITRPPGRNYYRYLLPEVSQSPEIVTQLHERPRKYFTPPVVQRPEQRYFIEHTTTTTTTPKPIVQTINSRTKVPIVQRTYQTPYYYSPFKTPQPTLTRSDGSRKSLYDLRKNTPRNLIISQRNDGPFIQTQEMNGSNRPERPEIFNANVSSQNVEFYERKSPAQVLERNPTPNSKYRANLNQWMSPNKKIEITSHPIHEENEFKYNIPGEPVGSPELTHLYMPQINLSTRRPPYVSGYSFKPVRRKPGNPSEPNKNEFWSKDVARQKINTGTISQSTENPIKENGRPDRYEENPFKDSAQRPKDAVEVDLLSRSQNQQPIPSLQYSGEDFQRFIPGERFRTPFWEDKRTNKTRDLNRPYRPSFRVVDNGFKQSAYQEKQPSHTNRQTSSQHSF